MHPLLQVEFSRRLRCGMQGQQKPPLPQQQEPEPQQQYRRKLATLAEQAVRYVRSQWPQEQQYQRRQQQGHPGQQQKRPGILRWVRWGGGRQPARPRLTHAPQTAASSPAKGSRYRHSGAPGVPAVSDSVSLTAASAAGAGDPGAFSEAAAWPAEVFPEAATPHGSRSVSATRDTAGTGAATAVGVEADAADVAANETSNPVACNPAAAASSSADGAAGATLHLPVAAAPAGSSPPLRRFVNGCPGARTAPPAGSSAAVLAAADGFAAAAAAVAASVVGAVDLQCLEAAVFVEVLKERRLLLPWGLQRFALLLLLCICSSSCILHVAAAAAATAAVVDAAGPAAAAALDATAAAVADAFAAATAKPEGTAAAAAARTVGVEAAAAAAVFTADPPAPAAPSEVGAELQEGRRQGEEFDPSRYTPEILEVPAGRPLRFIFGSCNLQPLDDEWQVQEENKLMWDFIYSRRPKLFAWLGDNIYVDTMKHFKLANTIRWQWRRLPWKKFLERYQEMIAAKQSDYTEKEIRDALHRQYYNPPYQRLLRSGVRVVGMYDDHDLGEDNPFKWHSLKFEARDALLDFIGVPKDSPRRSVKWSGVFYSYRISLSPFPGLSSSSFSTRSHPRSSHRVTVRLILVDVRFNRDSWRLLPQGDLLGEQQWRWLEEELERAREDSDALVFVASSIEVLPPSVLTTESWALFPATRQRLLDRILNAGLQMPVLLSGDVHFAEFTSVLCRPLLLPEDMHRQQGSRQQQLHHHRLYKTPFPLFGRHPIAGSHASAAALAATYRADAAPVRGPRSPHTQKRQQQPQQCPAPGLSLEEVLGGNLLQWRQQQSVGSQRREKISSTATVTQGKKKSSSCSSGSCDGVEGRCREKNEMRDTWRPSAADSSRLRMCDQQQQQQKQMQQQGQEKHAQHEEQQQDEEGNDEEEETERGIEAEKDFLLREKWTPLEEMGLLGRLFPISSFLVSYIYVHLIAPAFFALVAPQSYLFSSLRQQQQATAAAAAAAVDRLHHREQQRARPQPQQEESRARLNQKRKQQQRREEEKDLVEEDSSADMLRSGAHGQHKSSAAADAGAAAVHTGAAGGLDGDEAAAALGAVELSEFTSSGMTHGIEETLLTFRQPTRWADYMLKQGLRRHSIQRDAYYGERLVYIWRNVEEVEFIINPVADIFLQSSTDSEQQQQQREEDKPQQQLFRAEKQHTQHGLSRPELAGGDTQSYTSFLSTLLQSKPLQCRSSSSTSGRRRSSAKFRKDEAAAAAHAAAQYFAGDSTRFELLLQVFQQLVQHHEKKNRQQQQQSSRSSGKEQEDALPSRKLNITPRKYWGACCGDPCRTGQESRLLQQQSDKNGDQQQQKLLRKEAADDEEDDAFLRGTIFCWETSSAEPGNGAADAFSGVRTPQETPQSRQEEADDIVDYTNRPGPPYPLLDASFFSLLFLVEEIAQHTIARAAVAGLAAAAVDDTGASKAESFTRQLPALQQDVPQQHQHQNQQRQGNRRQQEKEEQHQTQQQRPMKSSTETQAWQEKIEFYCSITTSKLRQAVTPLLRHVQKQQRALAGSRQQHQQPGPKKQQEQDAVRQGPALTKESFFFEEENCQLSRGRREEVQRCRLLQQQRRRNARLVHVSRRVCKAAAAATSSDATDIDFFRLLLPELHEALKAVHASSAAATREAAGEASEFHSAADAPAEPAGEGERAPATSAAEGATVSGKAAAGGAAGRAAAGVMTTTPEEREFAELLVAADMEGFSCEDVEDLFRGRLWASIRLYALPFGELVLEKLLTPAAYQRQQRQALAMLLEQQQGGVQQQEELQQQQIIHWVCEPAAGIDPTEVYTAILLSVILTLGLLGLLLLLVRAAFSCYRVACAAAGAACSRSLPYLGPTWFFLLKRQSPEIKALMQQQSSEEDDLQEKEETRQPQQQQK